MFKIISKNVKNINLIRLLTTYNIYIGKQVLSVLELGLSNKVPRPICISPFLCLLCSSGLFT